MQRNSLFSEQTDQVDNRGILYVRLKGRGGNYLLVGKGENLMKIPTAMLDAVPYFPTDDADGDNWYYLEGLEKKMTEKPPVPELLNTCDKANNELLMSRDYIYLAFDDAKRYVLYQSMGTKELQPAWTPIELTGETGRTMYEPADCICIKRIPDAVYDRETETLYFRNLRRLYRLFPWLVDVYKEIEQETVQEFLDTGIVYCAGEMSVGKIGRANIGRMREASRTLREYTAEEKRWLAGFIREFYPAIYYHEEKGSFGIENDLDLKRVLYCVEGKAFFRAKDGEKKIAPIVQNP